VTGKVHLGELVPVRAEALEWEDHDREGGVAPEREQVLAENACVQNAKRLLLMKQERRATL
jgi:hypothetical protein